MALFDTHAHLFDPQLLPNCDAIVKDASDNGLQGITSIGTCVDSSRGCLKLAEQFEMVFASVGIHPNHCHEAQEADWPKIIEMAKHPKAVALGETGLDRHWDYCPFDVQQLWFKRHIELSATTGLPFVVHMRDCEKDILDILSPYAKESPINGIMHSFTGSWATAQQCLEWGMHISFAGMVTFKKSENLRDIAKQIPLDRLLVETDAPYLTPHPHRSIRPNTPSMVKHTAKCIAEAKGISEIELGQATTQNAQRIFGITR